MLASIQREYRSGVENKLKVCQGIACAPIGPNLKYNDCYKVMVNFPTMGSG